MSPEDREKLYPCVMRAAQRASVVVRCVRGIDARGLHLTNLEALAAALDRLEPGDAVCLVDGFRLGARGPAHRAVVDGDARSAAIAAASIIAKVTRDRCMRRAADVYPGWGFDENVGYSTPEHREAITQLGISALHRRSFQSVAYSQLALAPDSEQDELRRSSLTQSQMETLARNGSEGVLDVDVADDLAAAVSDGDDVEADLLATDLRSAAGQPGGG